MVTIHTVRQELINGLSDTGGVQIAMLNVIFTTIYKHPSSLYHVTYLVI